MVQCIICGNERESSIEHIIPEALGNKKMTTKKVCEVCNNKLGTYVDNYLTDYILVKMERDNRGLVGNRDKVNVFPAVLEDTKGDKYDMTGEKPVFQPVYKKTEEGVVVQAETIEDAMDMMRKRLEREGKAPEQIDTILSKACVKTHKIEQPEFSIPADLDLARYYLAAMKIAYEYANEKLGEKYYNDSLAKKIRNELYKATLVKNKSEINPDFEILKRNVTLAFESTNTAFDEMKKDLESFPVKVLHVVMLNGSADNKLICQIFLCWQRFMSFVVCVSENADSYLNEENMYIDLVYENGEVLSWN